jgi:hypothetical protein
MRRTVVTQTGTGSTAAVVVNRQMTAGIYCVVDGTVDYTIQVTGDDPASSPTYFPHPDLDLVGQSGNARGVVDFPVAAIRATVNSGAGSVTLTVLQDERAG